MGYFQNKEHFLNYIRKVCKKKLDMDLSYEQSVIFDQLYDIGNDYKSLLEKFDLLNFFKKISWDFKGVKSEKDFQNFCSHKKELISEACLLIENPKNINNKCNKLIEYCYKDKKSIDISINNREYIIKHEDISKEAFIVLGKLNQIPGVYFIYDEKKNLMYIGKSYNLSSRIISSTKDRNGCFFSYMRTKTKVDANILEPYMIGILKPPLNRDFLTRDKPSFLISTPKMSKVYKMVKEG